MGKVALMSEKKLMEEKNALAVDILSSNDSYLIQLLKLTITDYLRKSKKKVSVKKYNQEIDDAVKRVKSGKYVSHDQVMRDMEEW